MSPPVRIVIADDHLLFRAGIVRALEDDPRFAVVGEAGDGLAAERMIDAMRPDIALLDLKMPGADALQILHRLRHRDPPVAVAVLTAYTDSGLVHNAMDAGAAAYIAKDSDRDQIVEVLAEAVAGRRRVLVGGRPHDADTPRPQLTMRERAVLSMLNRGWSEDEILMLAGMTRKTAEGHLMNARRKLGATTTAGAIAAAEAWGLLT